MLKDIIPCFDCKNNYIDFINKNPIRCITQKGIIDWTIKCHNEVNKKIYKNIIFKEDVDDLYLNINYNKLEIFIYIVLKLHKKKIITKKQLDIIISLYPNKEIRNKLKINYNYKIPNKYLTFLLFFKLNDEIYISLLPDTCKKINHSNILYKKNHMILNVNNIKIKLNKSQNKIKNLKIITTSRFDYLQRLNKIKNNNMIYHII
jgi:hypothetical protein